MLPKNIRVLVCLSRQDMRKSFDTLAAVVRDEMFENPMDGSLYVFFGKSPTRVKVLWWDANGYCLLLKRLHRALFQIPKAEAGERQLKIDGQVLGDILRGVEKNKVQQEHLH
jgi:transposase